MWFKAVYNTREESLLLDVMAHDVTDPADVQTLGTLNGHKLAVSHWKSLHSWTFFQKNAPLIGIMLGVGKI